MNSAKRWFLLGLLGFLAFGFFFDAGATYVVVKYGGSLPAPTDFHVNANVAAGVAILVALYIVAEIRT